MYSMLTVSSFWILFSTFIKASCTFGLTAKVALLSTLTCASGQ